MNDLSILKPPLKPNDSNSTESRDGIIPPSTTENRKTFRSIVEPDISQYIQWSKTTLKNPKTSDVEEKLH